MEEEMKPVQPTVQPVSMHDTPHVHHGALPLITAMLGVFLVLETVALGYGVVRYVGVNDRVQNVQQVAEDKRDEIAEKIQELKDKVPPLLYSANNNEIYQIDRLSGDEKLLYTGTGIIGVFAVPQIGYDGRVFLTSSCGECDAPSFAVTEYNLKTQTDPVNITFNDGSFYHGSAEASADGTMLAAAVYDDPDTGHTGKVYMVNLLTDEEELIGELGEDEYFSEYFGANTIGGAGGFTLDWKDRNCVNLYIYQDNPNDVTGMEKQFKENRTFCSAE